MDRQDRVPSPKNRPEAGSRTPPAKPRRPLRPRALPSTGWRVVFLNI